MAMSTKDIIVSLANRYDINVPSINNIKKIINNKKVSDHHAIIPTKESCTMVTNNLSLEEKKNI